MGRRSEGRIRDERTCRIQPSQRILIRTFRREMVPFTQPTRHLSSACFLKVGFHGLFGGLFGFCGLRLKVVSIIPRYRREGRVPLSISL